MHHRHHRFRVSMHKPGSSAHQFPVFSLPHAFIFCGMLRLKIFEALKLRLAGQDKLPNFLPLYDL